MIENDYKKWLFSLKSQIKSSQIKASISVNSEMIMLYWNIGCQIADKQNNSEWWSGLINRLSKDLKQEFPTMTGFSRSNLFAMKQFYLFYSKIQQVAGQIEADKNQESTLLKSIINDMCAKIPWWHNVIIIQKTKTTDEAIFYIQQTLSNNWSRSVLQMQIERNQFARQGKAINNFEITLPKPQSDLADQILKDPYNFGFLTLEKDVQESNLKDN